MELEADERNRSARRAAPVGRMMIDNPIAAMELLDRLTAALPVPARLTPEVQASLSSRNAAKSVPPNCTIVGLHYMGDEGGILCKLDLGPKVENEAFVSILTLSQLMPL